MYSDNIYILIIEIVCGVIFLSVLVLLLASSIYAKYSKVRKWTEDFPNDREDMTGGGSVERTETEKGCVASCAQLIAGLASIALCGGIVVMVYVGYTVSLPSLLAALPTISNLIKIVIIGIVVIVVIWVIIKLAMFFFEDLIHPEKYK